MSIISTYLTHIISAILTGKPVNPSPPAAAPHFEAWNLQLLRHRRPQLSDTFLHVVSNQLPGHGATKQPRREHGGEFGSIETNSDMRFTVKLLIFWCGVFTCWGKKGAKRSFPCFFRPIFVGKDISLHLLDP